jgi:hypothetical protein
VDKGSIHPPGHRNKLAHPFLQDLQIKEKHLFLHFFSKISPKYFQESFQSSIFV